jgi:hypothetical protein
MNRRRSTKCMMLLGLLFLALPESVSAQSVAPTGGIWSYSEGTQPIKIAAKHKQRVRLPACPLNAAATKTCTCSVSGGNAQICRPGEACSTTGCGG